jgi:hypothetical protein
LLKLVVLKCVSDFGSIFVESETLTWRFLCVQVATTEEDAISLFKPRKFESRYVARMKLFMFSNDSVDE